MQLQKWKDVREMEIYGNGKKCIWKKKEDRKKLIDNYYLLRMILNNRFCFHIHFFIFDMQYIDKYSIERKCIPYIPENGKPWTISKDNVIGIWRVRTVKPIEAHTSPYGHGLHKTRV